MMLLPRTLLLCALTTCAATDGAAQDPLMERLEAAERQILELQREAAFQPTPGPERWEMGYDQGFFLRPREPAANPFMLQVNGRMQFRHTGFARHVTHWRDNAGVVRPVFDRNDFEIERGRLEFRGYIHDPALRFFMNIDSDTDDRHALVFHDFWVNYQFSEAFDLHFGKAFVPGSRDWLNGALLTRFADRSMATTFFRPDRTVGIWAIGEPIENCFYRAMVGNGYRAADLLPEEIDTRFVYSASLWTELGDYGRGYSDLEHHETPAALLGAGFTYAGNGGRDPTGFPLAEENFVRLSDGTRLTQLGALAPGVQVDHFDIYLYAIDAAFKYRGFSCNGEYFFRQLESIRGDGPLPFSSLFDHGYYAAVGYFLLPERLEVNGRISQVFGAFGDPQEYALGINWFLDGTHNWKFTFDATKLKHNPVQNTGVNLRAGDDGLLFRTQLQVAF